MKKKIGNPKLNKKIRMMNLLKYSLFSCLVAVCCSSCSDEELLRNNIDNEGKFSLTVTQTNRDKSRLAFGDDFLTTYWEDGDILQLRKVDDATKQYELKTTLDNPSATATFTCDGALRGGTYYVYYNKYTMLGRNPITFFSQQDNYLSDKEGMNDKIWLYGILTIETGQSSASIELKPAHSMLRFFFNDPENKLSNGNIERIGMMAPHKGFVTEVELQPDGSLMEVKNRIAKYDVIGDPFEYNGGDDILVEDSRAFILPVDLSDEEVIFYVSCRDTYYENNRKELVYEIKKKGIKLEAGVCYNIKLDIQNAKVYDLSDRQLDCPDDFRALAYAATECFNNQEYIVTKDIDFQGVEYFPITPFARDRNSHLSALKINGNGKTLRNLTIDWPFDGAGLLGYGNGDLITNLTIENANIKGTDYVGAFCGYGYSQSFTDCKLINSTIQGKSYIGGVFGGPNSSSHDSFISISGCEVDKCQITATNSFVGGIAGNATSVTKSNVSETTVKGVSTVGGIAGLTVGKISNCSSSATVEAIEGSAGGIMGATGAIGVMYTSSGYTYQCANTGNVKGKEYVGGIIGYAVGGTPIAECYSTGSINGDNYIGGITGYSGQPITNCYNLGKVTGTDFVGGITGQWTRDSAIKYRITNCYSAGNISSGRGIVGGFTNDYEVAPVLENCVTTSSQLGDSKDTKNEHEDYTNLKDINSKIDIFDKEEVYFPNRVWDTTLYPQNCTILLWQGSGFGVTIQ